MSSSMLTRSLSSRLSLLRHRLSVSTTSPKTMLTSPQSCTQSRRLLSTEPTRDSAETIYKAVVSCLLDTCKGLRQDGLDKQASDLFYQFFAERDLPPVVLTVTMQIVIAFNRGEPISALSEFNEFLKFGGVPNAFMYSVLIKGLSRYGHLIGEAKSVMMEMVGNRLRPNAATIVALVEGLVREGKVEEELVTDMTTWGLLPGNEAMEEVLEGKSGALDGNVRKILFSN